MDGYSLKTPSWFCVVMAKDDIPILSVTQRWGMKTTCSDHYCWICFVFASAASSARTFIASPSFPNGTKQWSWKNPETGLHPIPCLASWVLIAAINPTASRLEWILRVIILLGNVYLRLWDAADSFVVMIVRPSDSWKLILVKRVGGGVSSGENVRKTKIWVSRTNSSVDRRAERLVSPGAGVGMDILTHFEGRPVTGYRISW